MSYLPVTILAYFLNALAVTTDKFLLNKFIPDPLSYVFYFSLYSLSAILLLPFTHIPGFYVFFLASSSTLLWTLGAYFMFKALKIGQVSRVVPLIGALTPLFLFLHASFFATITINQSWAVGFLIIGLILLARKDLKGRINIKEIIFILLSSLLFAVSYISLREAYLKMDFLTVLAWSRLILLPLGATLLIIPSLRKKIFTSNGLKVNFKSKLGALFMAGQLAGGSAQLLLTYSISLESPALINSLQGIQYVFLIIFSFFLAKRFPQIFIKRFSFTGICSVAIGLFILNFAPNSSNLKLGVTYSPFYAQELGLNPKTTFIKMLDELKVDLVRLPIYWDEIETFPLHFDFTNPDFYISEALKRNVKIVPVLGHRVPRWPECFAPIWVQKSTIAQRQDRILKLIREEVNHFKAFPNIVAWQIENEPFLPYGECDKITNQTKRLVKDEVGIVKSLDNRPVLITDSGELSPWIDALIISDTFGHTLYRQVWNKYFGQVQYPFPPIFYKLKGDLIKLITQNTDKEIIISELQAEPWMPDYKDISEISPNEQAKRDRSKQGLSLGS